tara:strand:- start:699 stop:1058 length:360 start_codon:yes stop_codon:yes gene_type:complete
MDNRPKTIFCDIDGTLIKHKGNQTQQIVQTPELLPGAIEKINEWDKKGYQLILITGRRESLKKITEKQLLSLGIFYDKLIMGVSSGERIIINDLKQDSKKLTASAYCPPRNFGLEEVEV